VACHAYHPVRIKKKIILGDIGNVSGPGIHSGAVNRGSGLNGKKKRIHYVYVIKYFAVIDDGSPAAEINNRAVDLAREGLFRESEILLVEALKDAPDQAAVSNNLGIIYEIFGYRNRAFEMYSTACLLESGNDYFKNNFSTYNDSGYMTADGM